MISHLPSENSEFLREEIISYLCHYTYHIQIESVTYNDIPMTLDKELEGKKACSKSCFVEDKTHKKLPVREHLFYKSRIFFQDHNLKWAVRKF